MAKQLHQFPTRAYATRYNWSVWLDGTPYSLTRHIDFHVTVKSFQSAAFLYARNHGKKLRTSIDGDTITIQALPWVEGKR